MASVPPASVKSRTLKASRSRIGMDVAVAGTRNKSSAGLYPSAPHRLVFLLRINVQPLAAGRKNKE